MRQQAFDEVRVGAGRWRREYFDQTLGHPVPQDVAAAELSEKMPESGGWLIGTPDDAMATIERLAQISGGFGGLLGLAREWASREQILRTGRRVAR